MRRNPAETQLYFIADARRRYVKIGISNNPACRLMDLQAGCPLILKLELILSFKNGGAVDLEDSLHQYFAKHWMHREWFRYHADIKAYVRAWHEGEKPSIPQPLHTCKQAMHEHGPCMRKDEFLALLRDEVA